jgi:hypothetical protein
MEDNNAQETQNDTWLLNISWILEANYQEGEQTGQVPYKVMSP